MGYHFNPTANGFAPNGTQQNGKASQVSSAHSSPYIEARVFNLEEEHANLRGDVETLRELYHGLSFSVDKLKKCGWPVYVGPFREVDVNKSHQNAVQFSLELEKLKDEVHDSVSGDADVQKANGMAPPKTNGSVPPHLRASSLTSGGTVKKFLPPHLPVKKAELSKDNG
jgi:hypothetical protein